MSDDVALAFKTLADELRRDESYRYSWHANIAMAQFDAFRAAGYDFPELHKICNFGAQRFLDMLLGEPKP